MAAAVGLPENQHVDAVIAAAGVHPALHLSQPCAVSGGVGFDHLEITETVGEENFGAVQRFTSGKFQPYPWDECQRQHGATGGEHARCRIRLSEPVQKPESRCRRRCRRDQHQAGGVGEGVVDRFGHICLVNSLNRIVGELSARSDMVGEDREGEQIEHSSDQQSWQPGERPEFHGDGFADCRIDAPAPGCQQQREGNLAGGVVLIDRGEIQRLLQYEHERKGEIDQPCRPPVHQQCDRERTGIEQQ